MQHYRSALILGLASSGDAAARLLLAEGARVVVLDSGNSESLRRRAAALQALGAEAHLDVAEPPPGDFEIAVVSPGIAAASALVRSVMARDIPVVSELELGWSRADCRVLAISGSNGKSTLVKLCAEALAQAGHAVEIAGNYGPPVSAVVGECRPCRRNRPLDWLVLEVSSFQLETVRAFRPDVGILLNVTPNHLDRHGDFQTYRRMKSRLFARMTPADTGVTDRNILPEIRALAGAPNRWIAAGVGSAPGMQGIENRKSKIENNATGANSAPDFYYQSGAILNSLNRERIELRGTLFDNEVMGLTAAAAAAALSACGVQGRCLAAVAGAFQPLPHRFQHVGALRGIRFIDDSKATNLAAMMAALSMTQGPVRLIAGGLPKHESYEPARELLARKRATVYLIGQAADAMAAAWRGAAPCVSSGTLAQAVAQAWREAQPGDTIMLSPACASFDQFRSFEERGERFISAVKALS